MPEKTFETRYNTAYQWQKKGSQGIIHVTNHPGLPVGTPGDSAHFSPEHLLLASAETCLANYIFLIAEKSRLNIVDYQSAAEGELEQLADRGYQFKNITIRTKLTVADESTEKAEKVIDKAHHFCIISRSLNCYVHVIPEVIMANI